MTATAHALVGGALAASISNPALGIGLAAISHPLLDLIPHWDFGTNWRKKTKLKLFVESVFDLSLGVGLTYLLFLPRVDFWYLTLAIFAAEFWDMMEVPYWFLKWKFPPFSTIYNIQSKMQNKLDLPWGLVLQILVVGIVISLSLRIHQF